MCSCLKEQSKKMISDTVDERVYIEILMYDRKDDMQGKVINKNEY